MNCADFEILLCDYIDGTLDPSQRSELETHQRELCRVCRTGARCSGSGGIPGARADVEPPHELLAKIAFQIPSGSAARRGVKNWLAGWIQPIAQPRFAMGMAMTILSFSMLGRFSGVEIRNLKPSDLQPAKVWAVVDDRAHRAWGRAVKYYENLRLVYEVQSQLQEWSEQDDRRQKPEGKEQK